MDKAPTPDARSAEGRFGKALGLILGGLAAVILFILMMLTTVDVIGRYVFNSPLPGGFEVTELMMAALVFAALPAVTRREDHIVIDLLDFIVPRPLVIPRQIIVNLICAAVVGLWGWRTWLFGERLGGYGDVTEYLGLPLAPICYFIGALSFLTALIFLHIAWRYATGKARLKTGMNLS